MPTCTLKKKHVHSRFPEFKILGKFIQAESIRSLFSLSLVLLSCHILRLPVGHSCTAISTSFCRDHQPGHLLQLSKEAPQEFLPGSATRAILSPPHHTEFPWKILHFACEVHLPALSLQRAVTTNTLSCLECLLYWGKRVESGFPGMAFLPLWGLSRGLFPR